MIFSLLGVRSIESSDRSKEKGAASAVDENGGRQFIHDVRSQRRRPSERALRRRSTICQARHPTAPIPDQWRQRNSQSEFDGIISLSTCLRKFFQLFLTK